MIFITNIVLYITLAGDHLLPWEIAVHLAVACDVYDGVLSLCLSFFQRGVLDEILNLIESVSEGFPSYSLVYRICLMVIYQVCSN